MKKFNIFQNHDGLINVVKSGFCWPGFFLLVFWLGFKGLWVQLIAVVVLILAMVYGLGYLATLSPAGFNDQGIDSLHTLLQFCVALYIGWAGNEWLADKLTAKGFIAKGHVEAKNKASAMALAAEKFGKAK